jgi:hypothetical protein
VINVHGESGLRSRCDEWYDGEMESVYPNFVPEEGFLPLSKGQSQSQSCDAKLSTPGCDTGSCAPGSIVPAPGSPAATPPKEDSLPMPQQSPTSSKPVNGRYSNQGSTNSGSGVNQAHYLEPMLSMPGSQ